MVCLYILKTEPQRKQPNVGLLANVICLICHAKSCDEHPSNQSHVEVHQVSGVVDNLPPLVVRAVFGHWSLTSASNSKPRAGTER